MMPCVYRGSPNPETYAKTPFWHSPVARLAENMATIRMPKYPRGLISRNAFVNSDSIMNTPVLMTNELRMRPGYEAFACSRARTKTATKFVAVETDISEAWKFSKIHASPRKRIWK